jgi:hypothetical protein
MTPESFLQRVKQMPSGCHEWQSSLHRDGYGKTYHDGKTISAHRLAYRLFVGEPGELCVLHRCDNRKCVNPDHLYVGTYKDNARDMHSRGRAVGRRKLSDSQVQDILRLLDFGHSQQAIADRVGISQITVSRIKLGQRAYLSRIPQT